MSGCLLDEEKFHICCKDLLQHSDTVRDGWTWEQGQSTEDGYLKKSTLGPGRVGCITDQDKEDRGAGAAPRHLTATLTRQDPPDSEGQQVEQRPDDDEDDVIDDNDDEELTCSSVSEGSNQVVQYEYHILFSCSYQTPVLYFRASTLDGRSLSLEEVWNGVHPNYRIRLQNSPWDSITQQEHPLLGQSFFMLHPCKTEEFMRPVMQAALEEHRPSPWLHQAFTMVTPGLHHGYTRPSPWLHQAFTMATPGLHHGYTRPSPWLHQAFTMVTPGLHHALEQPLLDKSS
ncbi:ubiquitin-like-conjugating enzyme ATG10 isoform X2 [Hypomesus transpacificus]|uniref:ubiquitin-like-conjugating enzyme ATG10 isoform X2 n=1 Tax=Hypomesus transpacificus TaxID=137520 RepID=UPI001F07E518|nr:ubiquitin-like-conjugating enzyme ATG10 isoform X2 [Hypomesus transpacificus]